MAISLLPGDPHDETLRANVRPPGWVNPTPAARYQLVVLGAGPAGLVAAAGAAALGAKVALVERDLMGGDCLNVGCVPSKALLRAARAAAEIRRAKEFGITTTEPEVDFAAVMERVRRVRAAISPHDSAERFRRLGVDVFLGEGRFANEDTVEVGGARLRFGRCVIATGSRPVVPDVPGLTESRWFTNETVFALTELPRRLLVVGGGSVGCELGQAFARLGSKVTLATHGGGLLPGDDPEAGEALEAVFRREGIELRFDTEPESVRPGPAGALVRLREDKPLPERASTLPPRTELEVDAVLLATGRRPNVEGLDLDAAGITYSPDHGVIVSTALQTVNPRVYAVGDVAWSRLHGPLRFTHTADTMARVAVRNALFPGRRQRLLHMIPWCTYTEPEVASVRLLGYTVQDPATYSHHFGRLDRAVTDGAGGFLKVTVTAGTDRIVAATAVGPHAGEVIGAVAVAMANKVGLERIAGTVFPYPTYAEALKAVADQYNRTRLTPLRARLLRTWLRWFR